MQTQLIANRYQFVRAIGSGGMGTVFHVHDRLTDEPIALKQVSVPAAQLQFASQHVNDDTSDFRYALAMEFKTLASLRHPHVVQVLDYGFDSQKQPYFTMQYIDDAKTLTDYARDFEIREKVQLLIQMLKALAYLHRRGIVHRDLKPGNVLVDRSGVLKVLDFGLALSVATSSKGIEEEMVGTLLYMAPELFNAESASVQSDLYAVGVMAYELLVGAPPYDNKTPMMLINGIINQTPDTSSLEYPLSSILDRLLSKNPLDRYSHAEAAIDSLCDAVDIPRMVEDIGLRESFLQAANFVGRETEIQLLRTAFSEAQQGKNSAWLIGGESGVGKSRLLEELRVRAVVEGVRVLRGTAVHGGSTAFQMWRNILRHLIISVELDDHEASVLKPLIPDMENILNRQIEDIAELQGTAGIRRLSGTILSLLKKQQTPILLILEDLQWAAESLELLTRIVQELDALPALIILGSYRSDDAPDFASKLPSMQHILLKRLDVDAVTALSQSMIGEDGDDPALIDLLMKETEGNAFFIVEVMRVLAEEAGRLSRITNLTLPEHIIAGGVQAVVRRHLQKLTPEALRIVELAALIGRVLDFKLLKQIVPDVDLDTWLTICANASVFDMRDEQWQFSHDKIRETIIQDLEASTSKPELHRAVAHAIESVYPDSIDYAYALALHHESAGDLDAFLTTSVQALKHLKNIGSYFEAETLGTRALQKSESAEHNGYVPGRIKIRNQLTAVYERTSRIAEAVEQAEQALADARLIDDTHLIAYSLNAVSIPYTRLGKFDEGIQYALEGHALVKDSDDHWIHGVLLATLGTFHMYKGLLTEAADYYRQGIEIIQKADDEWVKAAMQSNYGSVLVILEHNEEAYVILEEATANAKRIGDRLLTGQNLGNTGVIMQRMGDFQKAREFQEKALHVKREITDNYGIAQTLNNIAEIDFIEEDYEHARLYLESAQDTLAQIGDKYNLVYVQSSLVIAYSALGMQIEAKSLLCEVLKSLENLNIAQLVVRGVVAAIHVLEADEQIETTVKIMGAVDGKSILDNDNAVLLEKVKKRLEMQHAMQHMPDQMKQMIEEGAAMSLQDALALCREHYCD